MFLRRKPKDIDEADLVNIFGYVLTNRAEILNYGDYVKRNIYLGSIIGKAYNKNQAKPSEEFDILAIFLTKKAILENGISDRCASRALNKLFRNFLEDGTFKNAKEMEEALKRFVERIARFEECKDFREIAMNLVSSIALTKLDEKESGSVEVLKEQLRRTYDNLKNNVTNELKTCQNN